MDALLSQLRPRIPCAISPFSSKSNLRFTSRLLTSLQKTHPCREREGMKIQCDVCEKAQATVICCADEAALCSKCDVEVHAANKLASKHQRLLLQCLSNKLPPCDICQEKTAFIFCVEDRALFCKDCDEPIHSANSRAANHQRFLAAGIRVALSSSACKNEDSVQSNGSEKPKPQQMNLRSPPRANNASSKSWTVDELLQFPDYDSPNNKKEQFEFGEFDYFSGFNFYEEEEALAAAEVPQLPAAHQTANNHAAAYGKSSAAEFYGAHKKPRLEIPAGDGEDDDEDYSTVPNLG